MKSHRREKWCMYHPGDEAKNVYRTECISYATSLFKHTLHIKSDMQYRYHRRNIVVSMRQICDIGKLCYEMHSCNKSKYWEPNISFQIKIINISRNPKFCIIFPPSSIVSSIISNYIFVPSLCFSTQWPVVNEIMKPVVWIYHT